MTTFTSQPDGTAGIDSSNQENLADTANNTAVAMSTIVTAGSRRQSLLKFDVSSLAGFTVISATLYIYNLTVLSGNQTFTLNSILVANSGWVEGETWNYANPSTVRWAGDTGADGGTDAGCSVSGTDYNATALGTLTHTSNDPADTEYAITLNVAQVQAWVNGSNYGLVVRRTSAGSNMQWRTSDYATDITKRPKLVIEYASIVGTAAVTLGAATLAATGTLAIVASAAITLADATLAATGVLPIAGQSAITLADATLLSTDTLPIAGLAAITLSAVTLSSIGTMVILGAAMITLADVTLSASNAPIPVEIGFVYGPSAVGVVYGPTPIGTVRG